MQPLALFLSTDIFFLFRFLCSSSVSCILPSTIFDFNFLFLSLVVRLNIFAYNILFLKTSNINNMEKKYTESLQLKTELQKNMSSLEFRTQFVYEIINEGWQ